MILSGRFLHHNVAAGFQVVEMPRRHRLDHVFVDRFGADRERALRVQVGCAVGDGDNRAFTSVGPDDGPGHGISKSALGQAAKSDFSRGGIRSR
jgi:hypothetical protein